MLELCTEILEHTSADEVAVCDVALISLFLFSPRGDGNFDEHLCAEFEAAGKVKKTVKALQLWSWIREAQMDTITLYLLCKTMRVGSPNTFTLGRFIARVVH